MTITEDGAEILISQFGEEVDVTPITDESTGSDPIYPSSDTEEGTTTTHKVRLYSSPSKETLKEYGIEESADAMMYSTNDIADQGDEVEYKDLYDWVVGEIVTNQLGNGIYLRVYELTGQ
jgi:hypothetical protein